MKDNVIIITGGGQRLGFALAKALHNKHGQVIISYRTRHQRIDELQNLGIDCIQADFACKQGVENFIKELTNKVGSIRAIIHNASDWQAEKTATDANNLLNKMMQIHVNTPYLLNLGLETLLQAYYDRVQQPSDVIHLTDHIVSKGSKKHIAYAASKAALQNLTLSFASKWAPKIKVNSIAPALLMFNEGDSDEYKSKALKKSLMQIEPGEIEGVKAVEYLLSSRYVTGHTQAVNGGRHLV